MTRLYRVPKGHGDRPATRQAAGLPRLEFHGLPGAHSWRDYDVVDVDARPKDEKAVEAELREEIRHIIIRPTGNDVSNNMLDDIMALIKSSNLALLERVEKELDFAKDEDYQLGDHYPMARNGLRYKQRQKLISLRKEYER